MKKTHIILSLLLPLFVSCSDDEDTQPKHVKISSTEVIFEQGGNTVSIDTEGHGWWLNRISATDEDNSTTVYELTSAEKKTLTETGNFETTCGWLTVKCDNYRIYLHATVNESVNFRTFEITMQAGEHPNVIRGEQKGWMTGGTEDFIKLSTKEMKFGREGGTLTATTENISWGFSQITVDGETYQTTTEEYNGCSSKLSFGKTISWLTVKRDGPNVIVTAAPNDTGKERKFKISLRYIDNFNQIDGIQE